MNAPDGTTVHAARIAALIDDWRLAKRAEEEARERRYAVEASLCDELPLAGEGTRSEKFGAAKVSITYAITRSVDTPALQLAWTGLTEAQQAAFRWKADVRLKELRELDLPEQSVLARFITAKPAKPSIKIEVL